MRPSRTTRVALLACSLLGLLAGLTQGCDGEDSGAPAGLDAGAADLGVPSRPDPRPDATTGVPDAAPDGDRPRDASAEASGDAGDAGDAQSDAGTVYASCSAALAAQPGRPSGAYLIDPDGAGSQAAIPVFCDMVTAGGGWMLGLLKNSVDDGAYAQFGKGYVGLTALATAPAAASSTDPTTPALAGWIDLNDFAYTELVLEGFSAGVSTFRSAVLAKNALRIPFGQNGYLLYNDANGYYWCGGSSTYTDDGVGQINKPVGAPDDCKSHTSLGNGWDFGGASANTNLTACGGGSKLMRTGPSAAFVGYPTPGAAQAFWVR